MRFVGEKTQERRNFNSHSPLSEPNPVLRVFFYPIYSRCRGDSQGSFFNILVLPTVFFVYIEFAVLAMGQVAYDTVMRVGDGGDHPTLYCIYIV